MHPFLTPFLTGTAGHPGSALAGQADFPEVTPPLQGGTKDGRIWILKEADVQEAAARSPPGAPKLLAALSWTWPA